MKKKKQKTGESTKKFLEEGVKDVKSVLIRKPPTTRHLIAEIIFFSLVVFLGLAFVFIFFFSLFGLVYLIAFPPYKISQYGISFIFEKKVKSGKFSDGTNYVVGSAKLIGLSPGYSKYWGGREINGAMLNIECGTRDQGFDSKEGYGLTNYESKLNFAKKLYKKRKIWLKPGDILVASISNKGFKDSKDALLSKFAVLTVLEEEPTEKIFRNGYCKITKETLKTKIFKESDINLNVLGNLGPLASKPSFSSVLNHYNKPPWMDWCSGWTCGPINHAEYNMPFGGYGREIAAAVSNGAMYLNLNVSREEKLTLARYFIQVGIDTFYVVMNGGRSNFASNGGIFCGRKAPVIIAGGKSGDYMYHNGSDPLNLPDDYIHFQEDTQSFRVKQWDVDQCASSRWSPDDRAEETHPYTSADLDMPEWNIGRTNIYGYGGNRHWITPYRRCCNNNAFCGFVLAIRVMGGMGHWNHEALFAYQDRYMQIEAKQGDTYGASGTNVANSWNCWFGKFTCDMWYEYRSQF